METTGITIDGLHYRVRILYDSLIRAFEIIEGRNAGTVLTGRQIRDILGTGYSFQMAVEPDPLYPEDYDRFFEVISAPVDHHFVSLPYGQEMKEFEVQVLGGSDTFHGKRGGFNRWGGLTLQLNYIGPSR